MSLEYKQNSCICHTGRQFCAVNHVSQPSGGIVVEKERITVAIE